MQTRFAPPVRQGPSVRPRFGAGPEAGSYRVAGVAEGRIALFLMAVAVALIPFLKPSGPANIGPVDPFIALALAGSLLWIGTSAHRLRFPYVVGVGLFMVGGLLGALAGPAPDAGLLAIVQDVVLVAWCWAVANLSSNAGRLRVLLATWTYSSIVWAILLFVGLATGNATLSGQTDREASRTALTFGDPSFSANYYFVSMMIIWATQRPRNRVVRLLAYVLLLSALLSTGSNSGIVSVVVGSVVASLVAIHRRSGTMATLSALSAFLLVAFVLASTVSMDSIRARAHESQYGFLRDGIGRSVVSEAQRGTLLRESLHLYSTGGPLGEGPVSTKTRLDAEMAPFIKEAHNDYFAALVERGPIGLLGLLIFLAALATYSLTLVRGRLSDGFAAVISKPNALVGAVCGTMLASTVYELLHLRHLWALFAMVAAVSIWGRRAPD